MTLSSLQKCNHHNKDNECFIICCHSHRSQSIFIYPNSTARYRTLIKTEGKFSLPIIHCIRKDPNDTRLSSILKQRTSDEQVKRYAQTLLRDAGSLRYTRENCTSIKLQILGQIRSLGVNPSLEKLIEILDVQVEKLDVSPNNEDNMYTNSSSCLDISPSPSWRIDST